MRLLLVADKNNVSEQRGGAAQQLHRSKALHSRWKVHRVKKLAKNKLTHVLEKVTQQIMKKEDVTGAVEMESLGQQITIRIS